MVYLSDKQLNLLQNDIKGKQRETKDLLLTFTPKVEHQNEKHIAYERLYDELNIVDNKIEYIRTFNTMLLIPGFLIIVVVFEFLRRDRNFNKQKTFAEKENLEKSKFLSLVTHELKTPVTTIIALSKLLTRGLESKQDKNDAQFIHNAGLKQLDLINRILEYSKLHFGILTLEKEAVDIEACINEQIEMQKKIYMQTSLNIQTEFIGFNDIKLITDHRLITSLLNNLLSNACRYSNNGNVSLRSVYTNGIFECTVKDTGCGISQDQIKHLFEPYVQVSKDTLQKNAGTGLGLNIVKKIVDLMKGEITVKSKIGEGSEFKLSLPMEQTHKEEPHGSKAAV